MVIFYSYVSLPEGTQTPRKTPDIMKCLVILSRSEWWNRWTSKEDAPGGEKSPWWATPDLAMLTLDWFKGTSPGTMLSPIKYKALHGFPVTKPSTKIPGPSMAPIGLATPPVAPPLDGAGNACLRPQLKVSRHGRVSFAAIAVHNFRNFVKKKGA